MRNTHATGFDCLEAKRLLWVVGWFSSASQAGAIVPGDSSLHLKAGLTLPIQMGQTLVKVVFGFEGGVQPGGGGPFRSRFRPDCWPGGGCSRGVWRLSRGPICCDVADQNHESQCGATATDGHSKTPAPSKRVGPGRDGTIWLKYAANVLIRTLKHTFASRLPTAGQREVSGDEGKRIA